MLQMCISKSFQMNPDKSNIVKVEKLKQKQNKESKKKKKKKQ